MLWIFVWKKLSYEKKKYSFEFSNLIKNVPIVELSEESGEKVFTYDAADGAKPMMSEVRYYSEASREVILKELGEWRLRSMNN